MPLDPRQKVAVGALGAVASAAVVFLVVRTPDATKKPSAEAADAGGASADEDPPNLASVIAKARPLMDGGTAEQPNAGTLIMTGWANRHLRWRDVAVEK